MKIWGQAGFYRLLRPVAIVPVAAFLIHDLAVDAVVKGELASAHFLIESFVFLAVLAILAIDLRDLASLRARLQREKSRNKALAGAIAEGIEAQMDAWNLTPSENDIAWMLVKGYRFSEIADLRQVKEGTVRLQATSLYGKAGVRGRAELVAEIVQELLAPLQDDAGAGERPPERAGAADAAGRRGAEARS